MGPRTLAARFDTLHRELRNELAAELSFSIYDVRQHLADTRTVIDQMHQKLLQLTGAVAIVEEVGLGTGESRQRLQELVNSLAVVSAPFDRIEARLNVLEGIETRLEHDGQFMRENREVKNSDHRSK